MPAFVGTQGHDTEGMRILARFILRSQYKKAAATITLTKDSPPVLFFDPDSADQKVVMPAGAQDLDGLTFVIRNLDGSLNINIRDPGDANTLVTVAAGKAATMTYCFATDTWYQVSEID